MTAIKDIMLFDRIQIETVQGCTRRCWHCPNKDIKYTHEQMPKEHFMYLIDQLKGLGFKGTVFPYLNNEIALDDRIEWICRYIQEELPECTVNFDSNGEILDPKVAEELHDSGVDLLISCYTEDVWNKFEGYNVPRIPHYQNGGKYMEHLFYNRGGNLDLGDKNYTGFCERPFNQMYIAYNGKAVLCCSDFHFAAVMGDTYKEKLIDIWNNDKYSDYRLDLFEGKRTLPLCNRCNYKSPCELKVCADS